MTEFFGLYPPGVLDACRDILERYGRGEVIAWPRTEFGSAATGLQLYMPARIGQWEGFKQIREEPSTVPGHLGSRTAVMVIRHPETRRAWRFPADSLTDARTGAAAVLAAEFLAPAGVRRAAILGTGRVAHWLVRCLDAQSAVPGARLGLLDTVSFYSRSAEHRKAFASAHARDNRLQMVETRSVEEAVLGAGVILLAAASPTPVLEAGNMTPGIHISALSGSPFSGAIGRSALLRADKIVVDQMEQCRKSGEMARLIAAGEWDRLRFASWNGRLAHLGDAALSRLHRGTEEISIAYLSGLAILDLAVAIEMITGQQATVACKEPTVGVPDHAEIWSVDEDDWIWQPIP